MRFLALRRPFFCLSNSNRRAIPRGPVPAKADPELPLLQHTFPEKLARPEQNKWRGETRGSLRLLRAGSSLSCGPGSSGALPGRQKRHENVAFHARHGLDLPLIANFQQQPVHLGTPHFLMGHFAATVKNHGAHFVAVTEEADNLILANLIVVFSSVGPKLYFFQLRAATALALLVGFLVLLVLIFPVVGDFADRRFGGGRNFHQIESPLTRELHRLERLHDAELPTVFVNHPDFARPDALVHAHAVTRPEVAIRNKSPSSTLGTSFPRNHREPAPKSMNTRPRRKSRRERASKYTMADISHGNRLESCES